jgi:hypothetical protein
MDSTGTRRWWSWSLWGRWVVANALGELIGLGLAGLVGALVVFLSTRAGGGVSDLGRAAIMVLLGTFEGVVVGYAQSAVLCRELPRFSRRDWLWITAAGAFAAWVLGSTPSVLIGAAAEAGAAPVPEIGAALEIVLAAGLGLVVGLILGGPQWWVLRRYVRRAGWWAPANALAWAVAMPLIFLAAGLPTATTPWPQLVALALGTGLAAGAIVGAVHGVALVWLVRRNAFRARNG